MSRVCSSFTAHSRRSLKEKQQLPQRNSGLRPTAQRRRCTTTATERRRRRRRSNANISIIVTSSSKGDRNANAIRPDTDWPPNDVSSDFRKAHVGSWTGKSATFDSKGNVIPIHEKFVPEAFKEFGVSIDDFDVKTVTSVDVSSGKGIDAAGLTHTTSYLYPEAGCEYGKEDVAFVDQTSKGVCGGNSQLRKMFLVDGSYCEGPTTFDTAKDGASTTSGKDRKNSESRSNNEDDENCLRFEFCFTREDESFDVSDRRQNPSPGRLRARVQVERVLVQNDGDVSTEMLEKKIVVSNRKWVLRNVELIEERNDAALASTVRASKNDAREAFESPATAVRIEGDDIGIGEWRPESGVTFVTLEALAEVPEDDEKSDDANEEETTVDEHNIKEDGVATEEEGPAMRAWRQKPGDEALRLAMVAEKEEMTERARKDVNKSFNDDISNRKGPEGLVVVPWWAVKSDSSWASAPDYAAGGSSPLVLLPKRSWILIVSANEDEFIIEMGMYTQDSVKSELRRKVMARRYKHGRLASCYFVTERQLSREEVEEEERRIDEEIGAF